MYTKVVKARKTNDTGFGADDKLLPTTFKQPSNISTMRVSVDVSQNISHADAPALPEKKNETPHINESNRQWYYSPKR